MVSKEDKLVKELTTRTQIGKAQDETSIALSPVPVNGITTSMTITTPTLTHVFTFVRGILVKYEESGG